MDEREMEREFENAKELTRRFISTAKDGGYTIGAMFLAANMLADCTAEAMAITTILGPERMAQLNADLEKARMHDMMREAEEVLANGD